MKQWAKETFQFEPAVPTIVGETRTTQPVKRFENMLLDTIDKLAAKYQNGSTTSEDWGLTQQ